jgi:RimJ/RimL family protein N-acetyltransferase
VSEGGSPPDAAALPVGPSVPGWVPPPRPPHATIAGRYCRLEPLDAERHAAALHEACALDRDGRMWTYLAYGPFADAAAHRSWIAERERSADPLFFAVVDAATERAAGVASYLRIEPAHGALEIGHLAFAPPLQRTRAATEALYLMLRLAFELGYRRCEWKCDALNAASRRAAERLGFSFEGVFRQATVYKGRNRDTAWYAMIDSEWPPRDTAFRDWLDPDNFEASGHQRRPLRGN